MQYLGFELERKNKNHPPNIKIDGILRARTIHSAMMMMMMMMMMMECLQKSQ
jgi:hypothetical protein